jgi:hypothetical protein
MTGARVRLTPHGSSTNYDITSAYNYVDQTTNATITSQTPEYLDAAGGETLTFAGTNLDTVSGITIDSITCPIATQTATSISCTTPAEVDYRDGNRKDLAITATSNTINGSVEYREFLRFTGMPLSVALSSTKQTETSTADISTNSQTGYNFSIKTINADRETAHRSDLICQQFGKKFYITPIATEANALTSGATYGLKVGSGKYLPLSHDPLELANSLLPSTGPSLPDNLSLTLGVNTDLPAVACAAYTGKIQYTVVVNP